MADEMTRAEFMEYMQAFDKRIEQRFDQLEHSMKVQFEETRGQIRFSLEAVVALRETTDQGFADMRGRVERLERR